MLPEMQIATKIIPKQPLHPPPHLSTMRASTSPRQDRFHVIRRRAAAAVDNNYCNKKTSPSSSSAGDGEGVDDDGGVYDSWGGGGDDDDAEETAVNNSALQPGGGIYSERATSVAIADCYCCNCCGMLLLPQLIVQIDFDSTAQCNKLHNYTTYNKQTTQHTTNNTVTLNLRQIDCIETVNCIASVLLLCGLLLYDAIIHMI